MAELGLCVAGDVFGLKVNLFEREVLILHGESFIFSGGLGRGSSAATGF